MKVKSLSRVRLLATPWTAAYQASPSMGLSRQEYWSGVPLPSPYIFLGDIIENLSKYFPGILKCIYKLGLVPKIMSVIFRVSLPLPLRRQPTRLPGEGNGTPLPYSCLENPTDGGAW